MLIRRLTISSVDGILRDIRFHKGLNLIVDQTPLRGADPATGNNVGKTTVLKLVDFCLGAEAKIVYAGPEGRSSEYRAVREYLEGRNVEIELELVDDLGAPAPRRVVVQRSFVPRGKRALRRINGEDLKKDEFDRRLGELLIPQLAGRDKPTFRQVIAHNIRIDDYRLTHTLEVLHPTTKPVEYESLYLFLFGCSRPNDALKQDLAKKMREERNYLKRLSGGNTERDYEAVIEVTNREIGRLEARRTQFAADPEFANKLRESDGLAVEISRTRSRLSQLDVRIEMINESCERLNASRSDADLAMLGRVYEEASALVPQLQRTFEDLVKFRNGMIDERIRFISEELPEMRGERSRLEDELAGLLERDAELSRDLEGKITSEEFERLLRDINQLYQRKGELEAALNQLRKSREAIEKLDRQLSAFDEQDASGGFEERLNLQLSLFNEEFAAVSNRLYGEGYVLTFDKREDRSGTAYYDFRIPDVSNVSSGKKQGEILCFDIAYTRFADKAGIDCLHFLLNDKKELVHGNQLVEVARLAEESGVQLVLSMLSDKLPRELDDERYVVLSLSQDEKLFLMEQYCG